MALNCPECNEIHYTAKSLYWHLINEHHLEKQDAFQSCGESIDNSHSEYSSSNKDIKSNSKTYSRIDGKWYVGKG